jgi:DNA-binding protein HU-beta
MSGVSAIRAFTAGTLILMSYDHPPKILFPRRRLTDMNKGELVDKVAEKSSVTKKQADSVLSAAIEAIMETVCEGKKVTLVGFGSFERRDRKEREGRNPKTGETMVIPATKVPAFSAGKQFKEMVSK